MAHALGADVGASETPEVGVLPVKRTEPGIASPLLDDVPRSFFALQWHNAEVRGLPEGALTLASSPRCAIQMMCVDHHAISAQFHVEITEQMVDEWSVIPTYAKSLEDSLGSDGVEVLKRDVSRRAIELKQVAEQLYINWRRLAFPSC